MSRSILIFLAFISFTIPSFAATTSATWYVRPDGGTRFSVNQKSGQCNGLYNAAYPGSGVDQNCAFGDIRYLWTDGSSTANPGVGTPAWGWVGTGGDTYLIDCPTDCRVGQSGPNIGDSFGLSGNPFGAGAPPPYSGTAAAHTKILGVNFAGCSSDNAKAHINGGYGVSGVFNLDGVSYVDLACLDITDHSDCGMAGQMNKCSFNYPISDYAANGIYINNTTTNVTITDVRIHGMAESGMMGATGTGVSLLRVALVGNAANGWSLDDGSGKTGTGTLSMNSLSVLWNGCAEEYPIVHALPYQDCTDDNSGGFGNGIAMAPIASAAAWTITIANSIAAFNTQNGFDLLELGGMLVKGAGPSVTMSQSLAYSNMGQQLKVGSASTVRNNIFVGNCNALREPIPGTPAGYNARLSDFCRGADTAVVLSVQDSTPSYFQFNTLYSANATGLQINCYGACTTQSTMAYQNNIFLGFMNNAVDGYPGGGTGGYANPVSVSVPGLFSNPGSLFSYNAAHNFNGAWTCPNNAFDETESICTDPELTDETWHLYGYGDMVPASHSLIAGIGLAIPGVTEDFSGVTRPEPPSIGALESGSILPGDRITVVAAPNPASANQPVTLTATVAQTGSAVPSGTITFLNGNQSFGSASLGDSGVATLVLSSLPAATYAIVGAYSGDSNYPPGGSGVVLVQVLPATNPSTTTTLVFPNPAAVGQMLTLTATVKGSGANASTPAGSVTFLNGSNVMGTANLNSSGAATFSTSLPAVGTYPISAQYSGNATFSASTSPAVSVTVVSQASTTTLAAVPNPVPFGQAVTLNATVKGNGVSIPTGMVSFQNGNALLGSAAVNASGVAALSVATLPVGAYTLTADYSGDKNDGSSISAAISVTVNALSTTASLVATPNPLIAGQALTLTATVKGNGTSTPAGTVNFVDGITLLGTGALNASGVATLAIVSMPSGLHSITAQYLGNASFLTSTSAAVSVTVNALSSATSLVASPNALSAGQALTLTATVTGNKTSLPAGTVDFFDGKIALGASVLNASGVATLATISLPSGPHSITAQYMGNASFLSTTSAAVSVTVNALPDTTSLVASPNPVVAGQALTLAATVKGNGVIVPTGTISFQNGNALLGSAAVNASGVATLSVATLPGGTYALTAGYPGDANYGASNSAAVSVTVNASPTTTSLVAVPITLTAGQTLTLTATVKGNGNSLPAGMVDFFDGKTLLGAAALNAAGVATLGTSTLPSGANSITAQYMGNASFLSSTSAAASVTVNALSTTSLVAAPNPVAAGQALTLTATVKGNGVIVPTGTVSFQNGNTLLGSAAVNASGVAVLSVATLPVGTNSLTADYPGDANDGASNSAAVSVTVNSLPTTTSLVAAPNPVAAGQALTLTATVKGNGVIVPTGTVSFQNGNTLLGSAAVNASGVAVLSVATLPVGTSALTADYPGGANYGASNSAAVSVTVNPLPSTASLAASPNPVAAGQALTLTATIKGNGVIVPTGTVSFQNGNTLLGSGVVNASGVAALSVATLPVGTYALTANYPGDANYSASNSAAVSVTVNSLPTTTSLVAAPNPVAAGQTLTLTATVTGAGTTISVGSVNFLNGATLLGTAALNASGIAVLSTSSLPAGSLTLTAQYAGGASFLASTSAAASVSVVPPNTSPNQTSGTSGPNVLYTDLTSGPNSGGEGNNGSYLTIFGTNFGATQGTSTVTINGKAVAQYLLWSNTKIGVQVGPVSSGPIVVTVNGISSNANLSFTVRAGHIYYIGSVADNSAPPANCATLLAANSYASPWGLTNYASATEANYSYVKMRTPYTYYRCLSLGDTLVFLNGVSYPYFDGDGWHASLTPDKLTATAASFMTIMARPGAKVQLGGTGWAMAGIRDTSNGFNVYSGLTVTGSGANGGTYFNAGGIASNDRAVGNEFTCPDCSGAAGAVMGGNGLILYGNTVDNVATLDAGGSNKEYHAIYVQGNNIEIAWTKIFNTLAYNGIQINHDGTSGFYNQSYHNNDISDVNGSGINLSTIDPSSGYIQVFNNVIHHVGLAPASDGGSNDPHSCIAAKGYGSAVAPGTVEVYNNTMYDCSSYLNVNPQTNASCAVLTLANQLNVTMNLVDNIIYQPAYAGSADQNPYICGGGPIGTLSGSNNLWYSVTVPAGIGSAAKYGTVANPLFNSATDYHLQSGSPAIGKGIPFEGLTTDFDDITRPNPPSIGAYE